MSPDERRYRVTAQLKSVYQIVIEAQVRFDQILPVPLPTPQWR